jgi:hypothetical protein
LTYPSPGVDESGKAFEEVMRSLAKRKLKADEEQLDLFDPQAD